MKSIITLFFTIIALAVGAQTDTNIYQDLPLFKDGKVSEMTTGALKAQSSNHIHVNVPDKNIGLNLRKVDLFSKGFSVKLRNGKKITKVDGTFYQGTVDNNSNSIATVAVFEDNVVCAFSNQDGNFEITGDKGKPYKMVRVPEQRTLSFECFTKDTSVQRTVGAPESPSGNCRAVQIYFEADYKLYQDKGSSVPNTVNYVTSLFNQVAALYANEQIVVQISQLKVWNTPDPYIPYTNTASVLNAFRNTLGTNFNGNLAHLLSTRSLGGGIAYVDVLCLKQYAFGVSAITTTFQNVPTYSWSVEVVTHELGHNIGSWHTHSCNWTGGALDNCYTTEGGCPPGPPPVNGGTIMSYCHLTGYGINFANGFGVVPGNHIRNKVNNATCLSGSSAPPSGLQTTNITNTGAKLSWTSVPGTQSYSVQYKQVSGSTWTTVSTGLNTTYTVSGLTQNTQYHWKVKTDCSSYTTPVVFTTTGQGGSCSTILVPGTTNITQTSALVFWSPVVGVSLYHLQYKTVSATNWIEYGYIPATSLTLTNLTANTTYMVKVRPDCNPNFGTVTQFTTLTGSGCQPPTNLQNTNITSNSVNMSWSAQTGITGYVIGLKLHNQSNWFTLGPINYNSVILSGLQPGTTYDWKVKNNCSDWSGTLTFTTLANFPQKIAVYPNPTNGLFRLDNVTGLATLYDALGAKVKEFQLDGGYIEITDLPNGVYYLRAGGVVLRIVKI